MSEFHVSSHPRSISLDVPLPFSITTPPPQWQSSGYQLCMCLLDFLDIVNSGIQLILLVSYSVFQIVSATENTATNDRQNSLPSGHTYTMEREMDFNQDSHTYLDCDKYVDRCLDCDTFQREKNTWLLFCQKRIRLMNQGWLAQLMNLANCPASEQNDWHFGVALLPTLASTLQIMATKKHTTIPLWFLCITHCKHWIT